MCNCSANRSILISFCPRLGRAFYFFECLCFLSCISTWNSHHCRGLSSSLYETTIPNTGLINPNLLQAIIVLHSLIEDTYTVIQVAQHCLPRENVCSDTLPSKSGNRQYTHCQVRCLKSLRESDVGVTMFCDPPNVTYNLPGCLWYRVVCEFDLNATVCSRSNTIGFGSYMGSSSNVRQHFIRCCRNFFTTFGTSHRILGPITYNPAVLTRAAIVPSVFLCSLASTSVPEWLSGFCWWATLVIWMEWAQKTSFYRKTLLPTKCAMMVSSEFSIIFGTLDNVLSFLNSSIANVLPTEMLLSKCLDCCRGRCQLSQPDEINQNISGKRAVEYRAHRPKPLE